MVALGNNVLLVFAEGRKFSCTDHDWNDIVMKRSDDGGKTWSALKVIISESTPSKHITDGNPAPVALANGKMIRDASFCTTKCSCTLFECSTKVDAEMSTLAGSVVLPYCRGNKDVFVTRSDDGGTTWTTPLDITSVATAANWTWVATGPPGSIEMPTGTIIVPADHVTTSGIDGSHMMSYDPSTNQWTLGALLSEGNECQAARLANGSVILGMRSQHESMRLFAISDDAGQTYSTAYQQPQLPDPRCEGSLVSPPSGDTLYQSNARDTSSRSNMTVSVSRDQGVTWGVLQNVWPGPSAYSSLAFLNTTKTGRTLALAWETGAQSTYEQIAFMAIPDTGVL
jgi:sialidase-1